MRLLKINPKKLKRDRGTQMRLAISEAVVREYADDMLAGAKMPPPVVFYDGTDYILADGFQRVLAAILAGLSKIEVDVEMGDVREAILYAVGANAKHGVRRTNREKRNAVETLLKDEEWRQLPDAEIARRCVVTQPFVGDVRSSDPSYNRYRMDEVTCVRNGTEYTVKIPPKAKPAEDKPDQDEIDKSDAMHAAHPAFTPEPAEEDEDEDYPLKGYGEGWMHKDDPAFDAVPWAPSRLEPEPESAPCRNDEPEPDVIDELRGRLEECLEWINAGLLTRCHAREIIKAIGTLP